jgi:hypothetical protein
VERLHRLLKAIGYEIEAGEIDRTEFGASTLDALHAFQAERGFSQSDEVDMPTLEVLLEVEQNITINISEGVGPAPQQAPDEHEGIVTGKLVDEDGAPIPDTEIILFEQQIRSEIELGPGRTGEKGAYAIRYRRPHPLTLIVRAVGGEGSYIASSATYFAAPVRVVIDLTTSPDGVIRTPSQFTTLVEVVLRALGETPLEDLKENSETHELTFLASSIGAPFAQVAGLFMALVLGSKNGVKVETLYGLFAEGMPPSLGAALGDLPEAGIDDAFTAQVLAGVLAHPQMTLERALTAAVAGNVLPASYAGEQAAELTVLAALRVKSVGSQPYVRGKTPLNDLLAAGAVTEAVQSAFLEAYGGNGGNLAEALKKLEANATLPAADVATLTTVLNAGELFAGNLLLVKDTLQRLTAGTLTGLQNLALLDESDWEARIRAVDPDATSIPQVLPGETAAARITRFAKALAHRIQGRYPTTAFLGGLSKAATSSFSASKDEIVSFLTAHPTFEFLSTNIDQYLATNKVTISATALADLKTAQRLHRLSPHYATVDALNGAGFKSAQSIYFAGRGPFLSEMTTALGSAPLARMAYARAQMTYATTLVIFARYNARFTGPQLGGYAPPTPAPGTLNNMPDLQALFGSMDYFECDDCQSVLSPAAYLVDLLQYLKGFTAIPLPGATAPWNTISNALGALLLRRPDIQYVAVDCANTNTVIPYIDLVNEVLESAIAPLQITIATPPGPGTPTIQQLIDAIMATAVAPPTGTTTSLPLARPTLLDTLGTTAERTAIPQQTQPLVAAGAYAATASVVFPLSLPFDVNFARTTAYVAALGTTRYTLLNLFPVASGASALAGASLGINQLMQNVINQVDTVDPWNRWGFQQFPTTVIDPETNQPYPAGQPNSPTPGDWVAALNKVPVLLNRSGLTFQQLCQLLEVIWVTQSGVTLQAGSELNSGIQMLSADLDLMSFGGTIGLTGVVLERANRYLRLWTATGLQMWELDWALEHAALGVLDDTFLTFLAGAMAVQTQLNLPFQEVLTFWCPIETRDVTSHLGDEDAVIPSTYTEVFANPAMITSWPGLFDTAAGLSGAPIIYPASPAPTAVQLQPLNGLVAALGLSASDISAILAASGAANTLSLPTLTALLCYQRLASALQLAVADLILWITLTGGTPFGGAPADTLEFLRRLAVLQGTGIAVHDLDYLLRCQSVSQSALAFTTTQSTTVLQSVRDAVAKAVSAGQLTLTSVTNATPIVVTTAAPHGLATGAEVFVTGVSGNTAANGDFTITVPPGAGPNPSPSPNTFTLNGSAGNGAWTGGGVAVPNLDAAVQTIVVTALAAATGVTADIVTPVLTSTGLLPLPAATIQLLLAQAQGIDPTQFPAIIAAFTQVANAGALFTALAPSPAAFTFIVQNAGTFGWLNPATLPLTPVTASPYAAFETLLQALKLQKRQPARTPKLFDVFVAWMLPGQLPADVPTAIGGGSAPSLALALNATVADVTAIVGALGATAPSLTPATQAGTLASIAMLAGIANALDVVTRYGINGVTLLQLATPIPDSNAANAAMGALQGQYPQSSWFAAVQPVEDALRQARRDALVAYLLGPGPAPGNSPGAQFLSTDDIYNYYLIDPEMCSCGETTRLLQPSLAIQQFVQQCFLNLTIGVSINTNSTTYPAWTEWSWRQQFRLWQANREVFLYPENYVLPELRTNASSFFGDLESDLQQSNCDADAAEAAFENYLRKLVGVSRLHVAAHYNQTNVPPNGTTVLHVFARTRGTPAQWYYRTCTTLPPVNGVMPAGTWSAWTSMNLDITSDQVVPVVWDSRLYLIWPIFKQISEKSSGSTVPSQTGGSSAAAQKFWTIQFAMSEFSAGQWQAKRTYDQKMYFATDDPAAAFMFQASVGTDLSLGLSAYYSLPEEFFGYQSSEVGLGTLPMPDGELTVTEYEQIAPLLYIYTSTLQTIVPESSMVDLSQEPSLSFITVQLKSNLNVPPSPDSYSFKGQDLVWGYYGAPPQAGTVPLNVLAAFDTTDTPLSGTILCTINNPRIIIPQQDPVFNSEDPFFVEDPMRAYLVQPMFYTATSSQEPLPNLNGVSQWDTGFKFETFYHPFARTFLRELEVGGVAQLMAHNLQENPQEVRGLPAFSFENTYGPTDYAVGPFPGDPGGPDPGESGLDFDPGCAGAYSLYNWEIFYHGPMFVASQLFQNQQYQDTMSWLEYIFNPTDSSGAAAPQRFWEFKPFNDMQAAGWPNQQIDSLLETLANDTQQGQTDQSATNAITAWMLDPFDPHMIASTRISAYAKATVMRFLDNLIAWGDSLYAQYTAEMVSQAEQLYIMADMILGPAPTEVRLPAANSATPPPTYAALKNLDLFSNTLVNVENIIIAPEPPQSVVNGTAQTTTLQQYPGNDSTLLFCIPPNSQLLAYWGTVAQRLYNIRHCLNMQGVAQPLPLYAPPINPLELIEEAASGASSFGAAAAAPIYRFSTYLQKAVEMANDVRAYGSAILSTLEKQDAETLAALRATQELDIQTLMLTVKTQQVTEAQDQITVLQNQQAVTQIRYNYYSTIAFMNAWETTAIALQGGALIANAIAVILDMTSGVAHLAPSVTGGAAGFGGSPLVYVTYGGENIGHSTSSWATVSRSIAGILSESAGLASTMGTYQRRQDDWTLQANLANAELTQIGSQITAATDRLNIANSELSIQNQQISNAQAISDFLTNKYTNAQLYNWMVTQLTTVYTQAYQLAFSLAQQAQTAYQYELGRPTDQFIQFAYWNSQYKGLTAGDSLLFDLRRMESQYLANNVRELELTKHVSLALTQPIALVQLLQTGSCNITLDETLFDADYPGHYFRRLRSVAVTIPCVTGPYTGVNATLSLASSVVRTVAPSAPYAPYIWATAGSSIPAGISVSPSVAATPVIATSSGQNDAGLFEVNLRDERWLPFEGQGAVSTWNLTLDPRDNNFDVTSVTDVVLHIRYSARFGGDPAAVRTALTPPGQRTILVSIRNTFGDAYYSFFNPTDTTATQQTLTLPLTNAIFPFSNLGIPKITDITLLVAFEEPLPSSLSGSAISGLSIPGTFGLAGSATLSSAPLQPVPGNSASGNPIAALTTGKITLATAPAPVTLTIPQATLPGPLQTMVNGQARLNSSLIADIVLLIDYNISSS